MYIWRGIEVNIPREKQPWILGPERRRKGQVSAFTHGLNYH